MSENEELMNVNPTVADSEPSTDFGKEPFDIFRAVDQANMEAEVNPQETQPAQPLPEDTANQSTQVPSASELESNENNLQNNQPISETPNGYSPQPSRKYTDDVIDDIVEAARQQKAEVETYRKFFASPMGERAMKQAQADYERIKAAKAEQNPQTPNGDFRKSASDVLGIDENDPFYSQLDNYIGAEVERRTSEQSQFIKQLQEERVEQAKADMGQAYAQHLIQQYGMPENVAAQAAFKAMSEASKKFKTFEPNAYRKELLSFEAEEIVPVAMDIWNKQKAEYESKINSFNQQSQPQPNIQQNGNNPSSTREAAERMLSLQNANYKASGNIPNGGAVLDGYDEGDDVKRFIDFANQSFLG